MQVKYPATRGSAKQEIEWDVHYTCIANSCSLHTQICCDKIRHVSVDCSDESSHHFSLCSLFYKIYFILFCMEYYTTVLSKLYISANTKMSLGANCMLLYYTRHAQRLIARYCTNKAVECQFRTSGLYWLFHCD